MVFTCPLLSRFKISSPLRENNNVVLFSFPFHILMPLANQCFFRLQGKFPILRTRSCPVFYPFIRPPRRPLSLSKGKILISGFILSPPILALYNVAHILPLGDSYIDITFTEDQTQRHFSHLFGTFTEPRSSTVIYFKFFSKKCHRVKHSLRTTKYNTSGGRKDHSPECQKFLRAHSIVARYITDQVRKT